MIESGVPRLVGLCGYARSGKDTAAAYLVAEHGFEQLAFADKLRALAEAIDPVLVHDDYDQPFRYAQALRGFGYEGAKDRFPEVRRLLVALGKGVREVLGPDVWLDACLPYEVPGKLVVSDVRYLNEVQRIIDLGGEVWYINRRLLNPANPEEARSFREIFDSPLLDHPRFRVLPNVGDGPTTLYPKIEELLQ